MRKFMLLLVVCLTFASTLSAKELSKEVRESLAEQVKVVLLDPDSARFKWLPVQPNTLYYCALVNSRNKFGGYAGWAPFISVLAKRKETGEIYAVGFQYIGDAAGKSAEYMMIV